MLHLNLFKMYKLPPSPLPAAKYLKWECQLPKHCVVASLPGPKSLHLKVELYTTNTGEVLVTNALLDWSHWPLHQHRICKTEAVNSPKPCKTNSGLQC
jgi:hypothetical protein